MKKLNFGFHGGSFFNELKNFYIILKNSERNKYRKRVSITLIRCQIY